MKKVVKDNFFLFMMILLTIFYFEYSVTISYDSAHYMSYVNIFEGNLGWNNWDVVRGPIFPIIIHVGNILFGKTSQGLIMNTYIYYLIMLLLIFKLLFTLLPFLLVLSIFIRIKGIIKQNKILDLIIVLFGFSFLHVLLHVVTGAIIDRYVVPVFLPVLIGTIILNILIVNRESSR